MRVRLLLPDLGELVELSECHHQHLLAEDKPLSGGIKAGCWDQLRGVCTRTGFPKLHISSKSRKQERFKHRGKTATPQKSHFGVTSRQCHQPRQHRNFMAFLKPEIIQFVGLSLPRSTRRSLNINRRHLHKGWAHSTMLNILQNADSKPPQSLPLLGISHPLEEGPEGTYLLRRWLRCGRAEWRAGRAGTPQRRSAGSARRGEGSAALGCSHSSPRCCGSSGSGACSSS